MELIRYEMVRRRAGAWGFGANDGKLRWHSVPSYMETLGVRIVSCIPPTFGSAAVWPAPQTCGRRIYIYRNIVPHRMNDAGVVVLDQIPLRALMSDLKSIRENAILQQYGVDSYCTVIARASSLCSGAWILTAGIFIM